MKLLGMNVKKHIRATFVVLSLGVLSSLTSCMSSPTPTNTYDQDIATLLRRFEEIEEIDGLPESSFLSEDEAPRIIPSTMKSVASEKELLQKTTQMANQNFYRIVGSLDSKAGSAVTGSFSGDVAALCWELRLGIAVWDITAETSQYHSGYFIGTTWIDGWTSYNREYKAYFLVPIPRSDRDAWMLGLNVRDLEYEDRDRLSRNTGVLITNVYDNTRL